MPVQPDSATANLATEQAPPVGDASQADSGIGGAPMPDVGGDAGLPSDSGADMGPPMTDMGGDIGIPSGDQPQQPAEIQLTPEEQLFERSSDRFDRDTKDYINSFYKNDNNELDLNKIQNDVNNGELQKKLFVYYKNLGWGKDNIEDVIKEKGNDLNIIIRDLLTKKNTEQDADLVQQQQTVRSSLMTKVLIKDGTLVQASTDTDNAAKDAIDKLAMAIRSTKASIKSFKDFKIKKAGLEALKKAGDELGGFDFGMPKEEDAKGDLSEAINNLAEAINGAFSILEDLNVGMGADDMQGLSKLTEDGESVKEEGEGLLGEGVEDIEEGAKEEGIGEGGEKEEEKEEIGEGMEEEKKESAELFNKIIDKIAALKKSKETSQNGYPFEDKNKQQQKTVDFEKVDDSAQPISKQQDKHLLNDQTPENISAKGEMTAKGASIAEEELESIKQHIAEEERAKARLSVELAAQQQLKGLLDNPLRDAMVANMIEAGIEKEAAEAIAFNSMIDGYEKSQTIVSKEAFETFVNKDLDDFVKVAKFTKEYTMKFSSISETSEGSEEVIKEASAAIKSAPADLNDSRVAYKGFWENRKAERQCGL
jgi:6-pyruvoyl-tetrahydropterin synthase